MYSGYWITFHSAGSRSFDNDAAGNVIILGAGNTAWSHAGNHKNNFLVLGDAGTFAINRSFSSREKNVSINLSKAKKIFLLEFALKCL